MSLSEAASSSIGSEECVPLDEDKGEWKVGQKPPGLEEEDFVGSVLCQNAALLSAAEAIHLFTTSSSTASYLLKARCSEECYETWDSFSHVPNSTHVICTTKNDGAKVIVFDLIRSCVVREFVFERDVEECYASEDEFVSQLENKAIAVGRLSGDGYTVIGTCDAWTNPRISPNGIVAFVDDDRRLRLYDAKRSEAICDVEVVGAARQLWINGDGSLVAVYEYADATLHIFDVARRSLRFICGIGEPFLRGLHKNGFSDCGRYLAVILFDQIIIVELDQGVEFVEGGALVRHFVHTMGDDERAQAFLFRKIDGADHFQYVTNEGVLRLCKRDEETMSWIKVE